MINNLEKKIPKNAKKVFKGILFDVYHWEQKLFNGETTIFESIIRRGSTQIICITKDKKIILFKEEQPSIGKFISIPGGQLDETDSNSEIGARRELLEETGMKADSFELFYEENFSGKIIWPTYYYIAKECEKIQEPKLDGGENIKILELNFEEFIKYTQREDFRNKQFQNKIFRIIHTKGELEKFKKKILD